MAAKKTSKKTAKKTSKPSSKKKPAAKRTASKSASKPAAKKTATASAKKAPARKKSAPTKSGSAKPSGNKSSTKKTPTSKPSSKKAPAAKSVSKKAPTKKSSSKKAGAAKESASKSADPKAQKPTSTGTSAASGGEKGSSQTEADKKSGRKGITVVENRPKRKSPVKPKITPPSGTLGDLLAKRRRQPLIPSGPDAPPSPFGEFGHASDGDGKSKRLKSPFKKRELDSFRERLMAKRRELVGDVAEMERDMASRGDRGGNPALDVAEQGSDAYDQSLSINLADADRKLIREIDDALQRMDDGVFGLCEITHEPIGVERLKELPWARLSIEAARDIERRGRAR